MNKTEVTEILLADVCYCKVKFSQKIPKCEKKFYKMKSN